MCSAGLIFKNQALCGLPNTNNFLYKNKNFRHVTHLSPAIQKSNFVWAVEVLVAVRGGNLVSLVKIFQISVPVPVTMWRVPFVKSSCHTQRLSLSDSFPPYETQLPCNSRGQPYEQTMQLHEVSNVTIETQL